MFTFSYTLKRFKGRFFEDLKARNIYEFKTHQNKVCSQATIPLSLCYMFTIINAKFPGAWNVQFRNLKAKLKHGKCYINWYPSKLCFKTDREKNAR